VGGTGGDDGGVKEKFSIHAHRKDSVPIDYLEGKRGPSQKTLTTARNVETKKTKQNQFIRGVSFIRKFKKGQKRSLSTKKARETRRQMWTTH